MSGARAFRLVLAVIIAFPALRSVPAYSWHGGAPGGGQEHQFHRDAPGLPDVLAGYVNRYIDELRRWHVPWAVQMAGEPADHHSAEQFVWVGDGRCKFEVASF